MRPTPRTAPGRLRGGRIGGIFHRSLLGLCEPLVPSDQLQGGSVAFPKLTSSSGDLHVLVLDP